MKSAPIIQWALLQLSFSNLADFRNSSIEGQLFKASRDNNNNNGQVAERTKYKFVSTNVFEKLSFSL